MHKVLTPYGMRKTDKLNKAQLRKAVKLMIFKAGKPDGKEFVNKLIDEYPALKRPDQQKRVVEKADAIEAREKAMREITAKLLEHIN